MKTKEKQEEYIEDSPRRETLEEKKVASQKSVPQHADDEIDLVEIVKSVWAQRRILYLITAFFLVFGIFYAFLSPLEYESTTTLMLQSDSKSSSLNSGLLRQFGGFLDAGGLNSNGGLSMNLFPSITESTPFYLHVMKEDVYFSSLDTTATVQDYFGKIREKSFVDYVKTYVIGVPNMILTLPNKLFSKKSNAAREQVLAISDTISNQRQDVDEPLILSGGEISVIGELKGRIFTEIQENGTVRVTVRMPDPYAAAKLTGISVDYLTNYISEYRIEKVRQNLEFTQKQYDDAKARYMKTQETLAEFRDRNSNIVTARAQTELERLSTENSLAASIYQGLAQQLEQARIKVQEETPVFRMLEPVQVPLKESSPNRNMIMIVFIFLGVVISFAIIFAKIFYKYIKQNFL